MQDPEFPAEVQESQMNSQGNVTNRWGDGSSPDSPFTLCICNSLSFMLKKQRASNPQILAFLPVLAECKALH